MSVILEVNGLTKEYKELRAVDDLSFQLSENEILGLLGPNGSGKSTTMNCILSLLKYNSGSIRIFGKEMSPSAYDIKKDIGVIFQDVAVFQELMSLSMAFMLSTFLRQKNAISGIVNVITLGCSFLCGIFVPEEYLPDVVKTIAHALPPYWYVQTNEWLRRAESLAPSAMAPLWINYSVLFGFAVLFFAAGLVISAKKSRIDA